MTTKHIIEESEAGIEERSSLLPANKHRLKQKPPSFLTLFRLYGRSELWELFCLFWPLVITSICESTLGMVDVWFVGHLGGDYLSAASLGNAYTICLQYFPVGLLSAMETLVSQAEGAGNERLKKLVLYRSSIIVLLTAFPILLLLLFSEQILILLGQDPHIAHLAGKFVRWNAIGLYPFCISSIANRYLVSQSVVIFPMLNGLLANIINIILNILLVRGIKYQALGFIGSGLATSLTKIIICISLSSYTIRLEWRQKENETGEEGVPTRSILGDVRETIRLRDMYEILKLAVPGSFQECLQIWGFEVTALFVGYLGDKFLASHSIIMTIMLVTFMFPFSIGIAACVRVGTKLGLNEPHRAKVAVYICASFAIAYTVVNGLCLFLLREYVGKIFTKDKTVIRITAAVLPIVSMYQVFDGIQTTLGGVLRGMGLQYIGAIANLIAFYIVGIPVGLLFAFGYKLKLRGIWLGIASGLVIMTVLQIMYLMRINFRKEAKVALARVEQEEKETYVINA